jgi:hypothetical protein
VPGGDEALAEVDAVVAVARAPLPPAGSRAASVLSPEVEEQLFAGVFANEAPAGALPAARRILAAESEAEREALIQDWASRIPGGTESVESFRREQDLAEVNDARRREMVADPGGIAALDAEDAYIADAQRGLQYVVPEYGPQAPRLPGADRERLEALLPESVGPPEDLIEIYKRGEFTDADVVAMESVPFDVRERARWIAYYEESPKLEDHAKAVALRAGGPLPEDELAHVLEGVASGAKSAALNTPLGNIGQTTSGVVSELREGNVLGAFDELRVGIVEASRDFNPLLRVTDPLFRAGRERPTTVGGAVLEGALDVLEDSQRLGGGVVGAASPEGSWYSIVTDPTATFSRLVHGVSEPRDTSGRDVIIFRDLPDGDIVGEVSARDLGGFVAEVALDPLNWIPGIGWGDDVVRAGGKTDDVVRGLRKFFSRSGGEGPIARALVTIDSPEARALWRLMDDNAPLETVQRLALLQRLDAAPLIGPKFTEDSAGLVLSRTDPDTAVSALNRRWSETLESLSRGDPELADPSALRGLDEAVATSAQSVGARLEALEDVMAAGWRYDRSSMLARFRLLLGANDPGQVEQSALTIIREGLISPPAPSGFLDFSEMAAREAERTEIARQVLDTMLAVATYDRLVGYAGTVVESGSASALDELLLAIEAGRLSSPSRDSHVNQSLPEPGRLPTPTPAPY